MSTTSIRLVPSWVEADPLRGRAIDALGLQANADRIAERLVPGLSVTTNRARYFAMLAWARHVCGTRPDELRIHRLEVALAVRESALHRGDQTDAPKCRFVGSNNLAGQFLDAPPKSPRQAYQQPVWRAYRASMRNLGLLDDDRALTSDGVALAKRYAAACRPKDTSGNSMLPERACLSRLTSAEGRLIEVSLGIFRRGKAAEDDVSAAARRRATEYELRDFFRSDDWTLTEILQRYETNRSAAPSPTVAALREAAIWERLAVGLNAAFLLLLEYIRKPAKARAMLAKARRRRAAVPLLTDIAVREDDAADVAVASIRRALSLRARLGDEALPNCDPGGFELGDDLAGKMDLDDVFTRLTERHLAAKGDDAWIRPRGRGYELARDPGDTWTLPPRATLHGYRLGAFGRILTDLRRARRGES